VGIAGGQVLKQLKQAWKRDRLGVLGVGSAVAAALMIVLPAEIFVMGDQIGETPSFNGSVSIPIYGPGTFTLSGSVLIACQKQRYSALSLSFCCC
jgi:hypothetical protein